MKLHVKKGDKVTVISGEHKGQQGVILSVNPDKATAVVEGVNMVSRHSKPSAKKPDGGIIKKEAPLNISKLMVVDSKGNTTRIGRTRDEKSGKLVRYSKKEKKNSGNIIIVK
jgi:large subunit ribosomal protein L24